MMLKLTKRWLPVIGYAASAVWTRRAPTPGLRFINNANKDPVMIAGTGWLISVAGRKAK